MTINRWAPLSFKLDKALVHALPSREETRVAAARKRAGRTLKHALHPHAVGVKLPVCGMSLLETEYRDHMCDERATKRTGEDINICDPCLLCWNDINVGAVRGIFWIATGLRAACA